MPRRRNKLGQYIPNDFEVSLSFPSPFKIYINGFDPISLDLSANI